MAKKTINYSIINNKYFKEKDVILISIDIIGAILGPQTKSETNVHFKKESYGDLSLKITITNKEKITPSCTIR